METAPLLSLHELSIAVDETSSLIRCRKALCDEGLRSLLDLLQSMKTHHVSDDVVVALHNLLFAECVVLWLFRDCNRIS